MARNTNTCSKATQTLGFLQKCAQESEKPGLKKSVFIIFKRNMFFQEQEISEKDRVALFNLVNKRKSSSGEYVEDVPYLAIGLTNEEQTGYVKEMTNPLIGMRILIDPKKSEFTAKSQGEYPSPWWLNTLTMHIYGSGHFQEKLAWILVKEDAFVIFQDANDDWRVLGDAENRVKFTAELGSGQGREGETKTVITAEVESDYPPLFFEGRVDQYREGGSPSGMFSGLEDEYENCFGGLHMSDSALNDMFNDFKSGN